jgi:hypothetical protein
MVCLSRLSEASPSETTLVQITAGGREVAKFCREHLAAELIGLDSFQQGRIGEALIQVSSLLGTVKMRRRLVCTVSQPYLFALCDMLGKLFFFTHQLYA